MVRVHDRISLRRITSNRFLSVVLLATIIAVFLHDYFYPSPFCGRHSEPLRESSLLDFHWAPMSEIEQEREGHVEPPHRPLGKHTLTPDGLLIVNPDGPHPIFQLIREAETAWEAKLGRASKTLDEAVSEYRRRYRRAPPLGFDKWWDYVIKHDVQLPDEYDEIFEDIEPFWGIDPSEMARAQEQVETHKGIVTIEKSAMRSGFEVVHSTLEQDQQRLVRQVEKILGLVRDVVVDLPPLRMTFSPFDNPYMFADWRIKAMALEAAANGTTLTRKDFPPITESGWIQACPPDSPARLHPPVRSSLPASPPLPSWTPKTFIASHRDTMDPCRHPSLLTTHGQFLSYSAEGPTPGMLLPRFAYCATLLHHDIRSPVAYGWNFDSDSDQGGKPDLHGNGAFEGDRAWEDRVDERLGWRGRTTGMWASPRTLWTYGHRERLVTLANTIEGNVSVLSVPKKTGNGEEEAVPVGEPEMVRLARINPSWMDIAFSEKPIGCDESGGTCDKMKQMWEFLRPQQRREEGRYKFILDIDGNGWSGRFKRLLTSNALVFKATVYPEWYTGRIAPWVHYVPIQVSYADLYDAVSFFRVHDELAARVAKAGQEWSRRFWRREDLTAYLYRLLLEYARVSSVDRASMDYAG